VPVCVKRGFSSFFPIGEKTSISEKDMGTSIEANSQGGGKDAVR